MATWNAEDYAQSSSVQLAWAREMIVGLHFSGDENVLDIGCGDGKVTAEFLGSVPAGSVTGIDSSPEMIRYAKDAFPPTSHPRLSFVEMDACRIDLPCRFHLVFSSAALHWIEDQRAVLAGVSRVLLPGGRSIITTGGRGNAHDIVQAVDTVLHRPEWAGYFRDFPFPYFFYGPEEYAQWLEETGLRAARIELVHKDMVHRDKAGLVAWMRTTWFPFTERLPVELREGFIQEAVDAYTAVFPPDETGATHVKMVRLESMLSKTKRAPKPHHRGLQKPFGRSPAPEPE